MAYVAGSITQIVGLKARLSRILMAMMVLRFFEKTLPELAISMNIVNT